MGHRVIELREWVQTTALPDRPWLLLGKGPTFSRRDQFDLTEFNLMSLNHVVRELEVDVAHVIDLDVVEACADSLLTNCRWLLMPRTPHVRFAPSLRRLEDFVPRIPVLEELDRQGRLVWYAKWDDPAAGNSPMITGRYFSAEFALDLLGEMGASVVRSLGVDGGQGYSAAFDDIQATMLANTLPSFDSQFEEMDRIVEARGLDYEPLVPPIRIFVGTDESQLVAARVLEYSIRRHCSEPVRLTLMTHVDAPLPSDPANQPRTAFSFARFAIPELAGYRGPAIYLDADMLVLGDVTELVTRDFGAHKVMVTTQDTAPEAWSDHSWFQPGPQMSVMVLDCSRLPWKLDEIVTGLDEGRYTYAELMFDLCVVDPSEIDTMVPPEWNHLEHYEPGRTKLVHFTVVPTQPWKNDDNPLRDLWLSWFSDAVRSGFLPVRDVRAAVEAGHVKAALLDHAERAQPEPKPTTALALELDATRARVVEFIDWVKPLPPKPSGRRTYIWNALMARLRRVIPRRRS